MKKLILVLCTAFFAITSCQQAKQKVFELASQEVNKQCPITVDEVTKMDSTTYSGKENTFSYYYTLSGAGDDPSIVESTKEYLEKTLPGTLKATKEMKVYQESNVTMEYIYLSSSTHQELFRIKITPDMYK